MRLEEGLVAHLKADANVTAEVGTRIYKERLPQESTYPAVVYSRVSTQRELTLDGPVGLTTARFTVDVVGKSSSDISAAAVAVKNSLDGVTGNLGGVSVQVVYYTDDSDLSVFDGDLEFRVISLNLAVVLTE